MSHHKSLIILLAAIFISQVNAHQQQVKSVHKKSGLHATQKISKKCKKACQKCNNSPCCKKCNKCQTPIDPPNNFVAFYRMHGNGTYTRIQPSQVRGPNVAIVTHGFSADVRAMPVLSSFIANFKKNNNPSKGALYSDVIAFQYDTYHTPVATSAQALASGLQSLPANVKNLNLYGWSLGNLVNRYAYEHLGVGKKIGALTSKVIGVAGANYGVPTTIVAGIVGYIGVYIPSLLIPPPIVAVDVNGGPTDNPFDPLRSQFIKDLNDTLNPFASKTRYYMLTGVNPYTIMPNIDSIPGVGGFIFETEYELINGTLPGNIQSDAILYKGNTAGIGVLESRGVSVKRSYVSTDHISIVGDSSFLGSMLIPASGYLPILRPALLPQVQSALTAWLKTF